MESKRTRYIIFFLLAYSLGFLTHWGLFKFKSQNFSLTSAGVVEDERIPVGPDELRGEDLMDALHRDMLERMGKAADDLPGKFHAPPEDVPADVPEKLNEESYGLREFLVQDIGRREDKDFVYYEVPLVNEQGEKVELKVEVKNGIIEIVEKSIGPNHEAQSSRSFSIEPGLKTDQAQVLNEKDKVVIKIPKK